MKHTGRNGSIVLICILVAGALLWWALRGGDAPQDDARAQLIGELEQWDRWGEFQRPLTAAVDRNDDAVFAANFTAAKNRYDTDHFNEAGYRAQMYVLLREALIEDGYTDAAAELEQFRSRHSK